MGTLSELLAERRALDAQIEEAKTAIARSGESVVIDGETIDSTVNVEGELANPKDDAFLFTYEKAENGDIKNVGELTYKQLVDRFAQEATTILNQAIAAGETSVENIQEALTAALGFHRQVSMGISGHIRPSEPCYCSLQCISGHRRIKLVRC